MTYRFNGPRKATIEPVCSYCGAPGVVIVNKRGACVEHLDDVFADAVAPLDAILGFPNPDDPPREEP